MMVSLATVKKHLRITTNTEDDVLQMYIDSAEEVILKYLNCNMDDLYDEYGQMPKAICNAICMMAGSLYRDREATTTMGVQVNPTVAALIKPYKKVLKSYGI